VRRLLHRLQPFVAYKVFWRHRDGRLSFEYYTHRGTHIVPCGKWLKSKVGPGFFAFRTRKRAEKWRDPGKVVRRVLVAGVNYEGVLRGYVGRTRTETYPSCICTQWLQVLSPRDTPMAALREAEKILQRAQ